jgi:Flp pilus assembly protein TadG
MSQQIASRRGERGMTILFVAIAMVAIMSMAALSIDVLTLYLAKEEAQRTADTAALAAARVLSLSGVTGDPDNIQGSLPSPPWQRACALATQVAQAVVNQNTVGRRIATTVNVSFVYNGAATDCTAGGVFAINPQVKVDIVQPGLPTFFSRIWRRTGSQVSATATAEAFNPSNSSVVAPNGLVTVNPRCVKPWVVPNRDPKNSGASFVDVADGSIQHRGIQLHVSGTPTAPGAVIGETFDLVDDCKTGNPHCKALEHNPPSANSSTNTLEYVPASIGGTSVGVPSCATTRRIRKLSGAAIRIPCTRVESSAAVRSLI